MLKYIDSQETMEYVFKKLYQDMAEGKHGEMSAKLNARFESCDFEKRICICSYGTEDWMSNVNGFVHGGVVSAFFDQALGYCSIGMAGGEITPTVSMQVSYLRPVKLHDRVFVKARLTSAGRNIHYVDGEAWQESNPEKIVATGTGAFHTVG